MGLVAGRDEWAGRSTELREDRLLRLEAARAEGDDDYAAHLEGSIARLDRVDTFIEELIGSVDAGERRSWAELAAHAEQLLVRWLGGPRLVARWLDPAEQAHHGAVLDTLARLGQLDSIDPDPGPTRFLATLRAELSQPAGDMGSYGEGVFVGRLASLVAADHDLVVVLGAVAGSVPARGADDALIPDAERAVLGGLVAPRRRSSGEELRDLHAALASAPRHLVTLPRADLRGQRGCLPAPWLLHLLSQATGGQVTSSSFLQLSPPLLRSVASFESSVLGGDPPASVQEHDVVALLAAASTGSTAPLSHPDAVLARGLDAVRARSSGRLGPWSGEVPAAARFDDDHLASATRLERYATCPFSALMAMLGLEERDDPTEIEQLDSRNRGSLVHGVLEDLVGSAIGRPPHQPWDDDDLARVQQALASRRADFEARGLTGRPLLWQLQQEAIDVRLRHWMAADSTRRAEQGLVPDGVEVVFGPDATPVSVALPDGRRLGFRGMIDRVDRDVEDGRFALYDYKTGYTRSNPFRVLKDDPVGGGRLLQLAIYAEAVRVAKGRPDAEVDAHYWLVDRPKQPELEGDRYGRAEHQRLQEVLGQIVEGMESGAFPRHPGEERAYYRTHEHCSWCPYDRSCPTTRGDDWEVVRGDGRIAQVVHLLEGPPPAEDDDQ